MKWDYDILGHGVYQMDDTDAPFASDTQHGNIRVGEYLE